MAHSRSNFLGFWSRGAWEARGFRTPVGRFEECQRLFYGIGLGLGIQVLTPNRPFWVGEVRSRFWKMFRSHFCRKLAQIRPEFRLTGSETEPNLGPLIPKNGSPQEPLEITMTLPQTPPPPPESPNAPGGVRVLPAFQTSSFFSAPPTNRQWHVSRRPLPFFFQDPIVVPEAAFFQAKSGIAAFATLCKMITVAGLFQPLLLTSIVVVSTRESDCRPGQAPKLLTLLLTAYSVSSL